MIKEIPNFPKYYIDIEGNVYSSKKWNDGKSLRKLKTRVHKDGYIVISFWQNKKRITKKVHKLLLETFVGPCPANMESCHNDGNSTNNNLSNLRWDTKSNNSKDRIGHGTMHSQEGEKNPNVKLNDEEVKDIKSLLENTNMHQVEIGKIFDVTQATISGIKLRKNWRHI